MSIAASGTQAATLSTTHTLATVATAGTFVLVLDLAALAAGETVVVEISTKVLAGGTSRRVYGYPFYGVQADPIKLSPAVPSGHELIVTLRQEGGTGRSFPWELHNLAA